MDLERFSVEPQMEEHSIYLWGLLWVALTIYSLSLTRRDSIAFQ